MNKSLTHLADRTETVPTNYVCRPQMELCDQSAGQRVCNDSNTKDVSTWNNNGWPRTNNWKVSADLMVNGVVNCCFKLFGDDSTQVISPGADGQTITLRITNYTAYPCDGLYASTKHISTQLETNNLW